MLTKRGFTRNEIETVANDIVDLLDDPNEERVREIDAHLDETAAEFSMYD